MQQEKDKLNVQEQVVWDKCLFSIFSSFYDVERVWDWKLEVIDVYINVICGNISKLQGDFDEV